MPPGTYTITITGSFSANWEPCAGINPRTVSFDFDPPELLSFERQSPATTTTNADSLVFRATFDQGVTSVDPADFAVSGGSTGVVTSVTQISPTVYEITVSSGNVASFSGPVGIDLASGQDINDGAGNVVPPSEPSTDESFTLDNQSPAVAISGVPATANGPFTATFTFDEAVTGFDVGDLVVGNGTPSGFTQTGPMTFTALITPATDGPVTIDVPPGGANDTVGNANTAATQATTQYDSTPPGVVISGVPPTSNAPFTATFTFDETVTGFNVADISIGNGAASSFTQIGPSTFTALVTPASDGQVTVDIAGGTAQDASGNPNTAATQATSQYDGTAPTVVIGGVPATTNGPFTATFTFNEAVVGFDTSDLAIGNGAASGFTQTGPNTYTALITPASDGSVTVDVPQGAAQDGSGNDNAAAAQAVANFDGTPPNVAIGGLPATANGPFTATFTFDESVTGFNIADVIVGNGTPSNFVQTGPSTYTALITPAADGQVTIDVPAGAAQDGSGNANAPAAQASTSFDGTPPSVAISGVPTNSDGPFTATFTFTEDVTGFDLSDLGIANGAASNFVMIDAMTYNALVTPDTQGQVVIDVPAGAAQDAAGNDNLAAQATSNYIDRKFTAERTKRVIRNFMSRRADAITAADPDLVWRLQRNRGASGSSGPVGFAGSGQSGNARFEFATSLRQVMQSNAADKRKRVADRLQGMMALGYQELMGTTVQYGFDVWVQGKYTRIDNDTTKSDVGVLYVAADYRFNSDLVVGLLTQFDWVDEADNTNQHATRGTGWMIGPYMVARLHENLLFDGRVTWGRSDNTVSPFNTYEDDFETSRWMARARLTGDFHRGRWHFEPHVGVIYYEEDQESYTDSFGTFISSQSISLGRLTFGPKISNRFEAGDGETVIAPHFAIQGIWDFDRADTVDLATGLAAASSDGLRARVEGGLSIYKSKGTTLTGRFFYDGIGADSLEAYGGSIRIRSQF